MSNIDITNLFNQYDIVQLKEDEVERLMDFIRENPLEPDFEIDSITLAVKHKKMRICCLQTRTEADTVYYNVAVMMPDKIIKAKCFSDNKKLPESTGDADIDAILNLGAGNNGLCESTGDTEIDTILNDVCSYFKLYKESSFEYIASSRLYKQKKSAEYNEKCEKMRSQIIDFETSMREKYGIK